MRKSFDEKTQPVNQWPDKPKKESLKGKQTVILNGKTVTLSQLRGGKVNANDTTDMVFLQTLFNDNPDIAYIYAAALEGESICSSDHPILVADYGKHKFISFNMLGSAGVMDGRSAFKEGHDILKESHLEVGRKQLVIKQLVEQAKSVSGIALQEYCLTKEEEAQLIEELNALGGSWKIEKHSRHQVATLYDSSKLTLSKSDHDPNDYQWKRLSLTFKDNKAEAGSPNSLTVHNAWVDYDLKPEAVQAGMAALTEEQSKNLQHAHILLMDLNKDLRRPSKGGPLQKVPLRLRSDSVGVASTDLAMVADKDGTRMLPSQAYTTMAADGKLESKQLSGAQDSKQEFYTLQRMRSLIPLTSEDQAKKADGTRNFSTYQDDVRTAADILSLYVAPAENLRGGKVEFQIKMLPNNTAKNFSRINSFFNYLKTRVAVSEHASGKIQTQYQILGVDAEYLVNIADATAVPLINSWIDDYSICLQKIAFAEEKIFKTFEPLFSEIQALFTRKNDQIYLQFSVKKTEDNRAFRKEFEEKLNALALEHPLKKSDGSLDFTRLDAVFVAMQSLPKAPAAEDKQHSRVSSIKKIDEALQVISGNIGSDPVNRDVHVESLNEKGVWIHYNPSNHAYFYEVVNSVVERDAKSDSNNPGLIFISQDKIAAVLAALPKAYERIADLDMAGLQSQLRRLTGDNDLVLRRSFQNNDTSYEITSLAPCLYESGQSSAASSGLINSQQLQEKYASLQAREQRLKAKYKSALEDIAALEPIVGKISDPASTYPSLVDGDDCLIVTVPGRIANFLAKKAGALPGISKELHATESGLQFKIYCSADHVKTFRKILQETLGSREITELAQARTTETYRAELRNISGDKDIYVGKIIDDHSFDVAYQISTADKELGKCIGSSLGINEETSVIVFAPEKLNHVDAAIRKFSQVSFITASPGIPHMNRLHYQAFLKKCLDEEVGLVMKSMNLVNQAGSYQETGALPDKKASESKQQLEIKLLSSTKTNQPFLDELQRWATLNKKPIQTEGQRIVIQKDDLNNFHGFVSTYCLQKDILFALQPGETPDSKKVSRALDSAASRVFTVKLPIDIRFFRQFFLEQNAIDMRLVREKLNSALEIFIQKKTTDAEKLECINVICNPTGDINKLLTPDGYWTRFVMGMSVWRDLLDEWNRKQQELQPKTQSSSSLS